MSKRVLPQLLVVAFGIGMVAWVVFSPFWQALQRVGGVMRLVHAEYVDAEAVSYEQMAVAALRGIMDGLDQHSRYMVAEEFDRLEEGTQQRYVGIGVEIEQVRDRIIIVTVFPDGPSAQAGLLPGDRIVRADGESVEEWSVAQLSRNLRGEAGTGVVVGIQRPGAAEELEFTLNRAAVQTPSVEAVNRYVDGIVYLRIRQFGERTALEVRAVIEQQIGQGMSGLILDLRDNPGGLLKTSKDVAALFFDPGELLVYTAGRTPDTRTDFLSIEQKVVGDVPVVVLVNAQSASGAEVVAGALQDTRRAVVVGETTHGKGSVQSIFQFEDGGGMRLTTARYYLPSGRSIDATGVVPDIEVTQSGEDRVKLRLQERHLPFMNPVEFAERFEFEPDVQDEPLEKALLQVREQLQLRL